MGRALRVTIPFPVDLQCGNRTGISRASTAFLLVSCCVSAGVAFSSPSLTVCSFITATWALNSYFIQ